MLSCRGSDRHTFTHHAPIASVLLLPSPVIFPPVASSPPTGLHSLKTGCYLKHGSTIVYLPSYSTLSAAAFGDSAPATPAWVLPGFWLQTLNWGDSAVSGQVLLVSKRNADVCKHFSLCRKTYVQTLENLQVDTEALALVVGLKLKKKQHSHRPVFGAEWWALIPGVMLQSSEQILHVRRMLLGKRRFAKLVCYKPLVEN